MDKINVIIGKTLPANKRTILKDIILEKAIKVAIKLKSIDINNVIRVTIILQEDNSFTYSFLPRIAGRARYGKEFVKLFEMSLNKTF